MDLKETSLTVLCINSGLVCMGCLFTFCNSKQLSLTSKYRKEDQLADRIVSDKSIRLL